MKNLAFYSMMYTGSSVLLKLFGFLIFLYVAREVSVESYAKFGILYSIQIGVTLFSSAGIVQIVIGKLKNHDTLKKQGFLFSKANFLLLLMAITSLIIVFILSLFYQKDSFFGELIIIVGLNGILVSFFSIQSQMMRFQEKHIQALLFLFCGPMLAHLAGAIGFELNKTIYSYFVGFLFGQILILPILLLFKIGHLSVYFNFKTIKPMLIKMLPFFVITFFGWISGYGNTLIIDNILLSSDVAIFTFLITISSILQLIATSMNMVWNPRFYKNTHKLPMVEVETLNRQFYLQQSIILGVAGGIILFLFPKLILLVGDNFQIYSEMNYQLYLLLLGYVILGIWWHSSNYFLAHEKGIELRNITINSGIIGILAWVVAMIYLGSDGIYYGFLFQLIVRISWTYFSARKIWKVSVSWLSMLLGPALVSTGFFLEKLLM